ncbi:hypothetical protein KKF05_04245 [Patescibacteria group bacterium]|nr:hypothetical protein [Patescibacteria group bacterium]MBU1028993.1 hypothetical protein [Patescibacteria group bacterium]
MLEKKSLATLATLVYHLHPDLEIAVIDWVIRTHEAVVKALRFQGIAGVKFIPAGPLRIEDFGEFGGCVDHARLLRAYGLVFIDTGDGRQPLDQHRQIDSRERSSIERLVEEAAEEAVDLLALLPIVRVVASNDLHGTDTVIRDGTLRSEQTPHVDRHLRNLMAGLNIVYGEQPETVIKLVHMAMNGVARELSAEIAKVTAELREQFQSEDRAKDARDRQLVKQLGDKLGRKPTSEELEEMFTNISSSETETGWSSRFELIEQAEDNAVRRLFAWDKLVDGVRQAYAHKPRTAKFFEEAAEAAFLALEREWQLGEADYWNPAKTKVIRGVSVDPEAFGLPASNDGQPIRLNVVVIRSQSSWAGKVCRLGNPRRSRRGKELPLLFPDHEIRPKADIVIQIADEGPAGTRVQVSTRSKITLDPIARRLRLADLRQRYSCLEAGSNGQLSFLAESREAADQLVAGLKREGMRQVRAFGSKVVIYRHRGYRFSDTAQVVQRLMAGGRQVIILDQDAQEALSERGNNTITVRNAQWRQEVVTVLYSAEFGTLVGNAYATNPFAPRCRLAGQGIVAVTIATMRDSARYLEERLNDAQQSAE